MRATDMPRKGPLLAGFLSALEEFSASCAEMRRGRGRGPACQNTCLACLKVRFLRIDAQEPKLTALGICRECGVVTDVVDLPLLKLYRASGISPSVIAEHLPQVRQAMPYLPMLTEVQILARISQLLPVAVPDRPKTSGDPRCTD